MNIPFQHGQRSDSATGGIRPHLPAAQPEERREFEHTRDLLFGLAGRLTESSDRPALCHELFARVDSGLSPLDRAALRYRVLDNEPSPTRDRLLAAIESGHAPVLTNLPELVRGLASVSLRDGQHRPYFPYQDGEGEKNFEFDRTASVDQNSDTCLGWIAEVAGRHALSLSSTALRCEREFIARTLELVAARYHEADILLWDIDRTLGDTCAVVLPEMKATVFYPWVFRPSVLPLMRFLHAAYPSLAQGILTGRAAAGVGRSLTTTEELGVLRQSGLIEDAFVFSVEALARTTPPQRLDVEVPSRLSVSLNGRVKLLALRGLKAIGLRCLLVDDSPMVLRGTEWAESVVCPEPGYTDSQAAIPADPIVSALTPLVKTALSRLYLRQK